MFSICPSKYATVMLLVAILWGVEDKEQSIEHYMVSHSLRHTSGLAERRSI